MGSKAGTIRIADAREQDAQAIIDVCNVVAGETDNLTFGAGEFPQQDAAAEWEHIRRSVQAGGGFLCALDDSGCEPTLVGTACWSVGGRPRTRHRATLGMSVLRAWWGMGVGTALLQEVVDRLEADPLTQVLALEVRCDNERAIRLYQRFGLEVTGIERGLLKVGGQLVDAYAMSRLV